MSKIILTDAQVTKVIAECCDKFHDEDHRWQTRSTFGGAVEKLYPHWEMETLEIALSETMGYDVSFHDVDEKQMGKITAAYAATFGTAAQEWYKEHP